MRELLTKVREGMAVYDRDNEKVGTVRDVHLGADPHAATTTPLPTPHSFVDDIARGLAPDDFPEVVRERLRHEGFVRIDVSGPFAADRYAFAGQIRDVSEDAVRLDVARDDLLRR